MPIPVAAQAGSTSPEALVLGAQIDAHFRLMPVVLVINAVVPPVYFAAAHGALDLARVALWQGAMLVVLGLRLLLRAAYQRHRPAPPRAPMWARWSTLGSLITGVLWGAMSVLLWPAGVEFQILLGAILAGLTAGAVASLTPFLPPFYAFVPAAIVPYSTVALHGGEPVLHAASALLLVFMIAMLVMARILNRSFVSALRLRFENLDLLRDLEAQKLAADAANRTTSHFVAAISHDLRQPLHALGLFVAALRGRIKDPAASEIVNRIDSSIEAMNGLFNALLDISRLDAGVVQPQRRDFRIQELFDRIEPGAQMEAHGRRIGIRFRRTDAVLYSDPDLLEVILRNLVNNALNYSHRGRVLVACRSAGERACIQIWDQGIGIPAQHQSRIFEDYYQVAPVAGRSSGRAHIGLGLAIVMRLARILRHELDLRSRVGRGTVFTLEVPRGEPARACAAREDSAHAAALRGILVVVIDDEAPIRTGMERLLGDWGCRVVAAASAAEAIERLARDRAVPAAVISDYYIGPGENGIDAGRRIAEEYNADIPLLLMTGESEPSRLRAIHDSGLTVLQKPIPAQVLRSTLGRVARMPAQAVTPTAARAGERPQPPECD